jgi:hypothetical protein
MTPVEKACCAAMSQDCGHMPRAQSCCRVEALRIQQGAVSAKFSPDPPSLVVAAVLPRIPAGDVIARSSSATHAGLSPPARGVPTYVLVSAFRI